MIALANGNRSNTECGGFGDHRRRQPILRKTCRRLLLHWQTKEGKSAVSEPTGMLGPGTSVY